MILKMTTLFVRVNVYKYENINSYFTKQIELSDRSSFNGANLIVADGKNLSTTSVVDKMV